MDLYPVDYAIIYYKLQKIRKFIPINSLRKFVEDDIDFDTDNAGTIEMSGNENKELNELIEEENRIHALIWDEWTHYIELKEGEEMFYAHECKVIYFESQRHKKRFILIKK